MTKSTYYVLFLAINSYLMSSCKKSSGGDSPVVVQETEEATEEDNGGSAITPVAPEVSTVKDSSVTSTTDLVTLDSLTVVYVDEGSLLNLDINNAATGGNDTSMAYSCYFDSTIDETVEPVQACTELPGNASFDSSTGVLSWQVADGLFTKYEVRVTGSKGSATDDEIFTIVTRQSFDRSNLVMELDAFHVDGVNPAASSSTWTDLSGNGFHGTLTQGDWQGDGTNLSPYRLRFDGDDYISFSSPLSSPESFLVSAWVNPAASATDGLTLFEYGGDGSDSIHLFNSDLDGSLSLRMVGGAVEDYYTAVISDTPLVYLRLDESSGTVAGDSSGNSQHGTISNSISMGEESSLDNNEGLSFGLDRTDGEINLSLPALNTSSGEFVTVEFWLNWDGSSGGMPMGFQSYPLYFTGNKFGFNTGNGDVYGMSSDGLAGSWIHIVAIYNNGDITKNKIYVNGEEQSISQIQGTSVSRNVSTNLRINGWTNSSGYKIDAKIDEFAVYNGELSSSRILAHYEAGMKKSCSTDSLVSDGDWNHVAALYESGTASLFINGKVACKIDSVRDLNSDQSSYSMSLGAQRDGLQAWSGDLIQMQIYGASHGSLNGQDTIQEIYLKSEDRYRNTKLVSDPLQSEYIVLLDPAYGKERIEYPGTGCGNEWSSLALGGATATLSGFASCGVSSGWNGDGSESSPYHLAFDAVDDRVKMTADFDTSSSGVNTTIFWMYWNGSFGDMLFGFDNYDLYFSGDKFGFNTLAGDIFGISSIGLESRWVHVVTEFHNNNVASNKIYIDGVEVTATQLQGTPFNRSASEEATLGSYNNNAYFFDGSIAYFSAIPRSLSADEVQSHCQLHVSRFSGASCTSP